MMSVVGGATVADAMIRFPKVSCPATTVAQAHRILLDDHVHAVLVVDNGVLVAVVERSDITFSSPDIPAHLFGGLEERVTGPEADLDDTWRSMTAARRRRLAVIDDQDRLLGLLRLKRTGRGFCSDLDVRARIDERSATVSPRRSSPSLQWE